MLVNHIFQFQPKNVVNLGIMLGNTWMFKKNSNPTVRDNSQ